MTVDLDLLRTFGAGYAAVVQTTFFILYCQWRPWRGKFLSRALFFKAIALMFVMGVVFASRLFDLLWEDELFTLMYYVLGWGLTVQLIAFLRVWNDQKKKKKGEALDERDGE